MQKKLILATIHVALLSIFTIALIKAQYLMDMIGTTKNMGQDMLSMVKNSTTYASAVTFNHSFNPHNPRVLSLSTEVTLLPLFTTVHLMVLTFIFYKI